MYDVLGWTVVGMWVCFSLSFVSPLCGGDGYFSSPSFLCFISAFFSCVLSLSNFT